MISHPFGTPCLILVPFWLPFGSHDFPLATLCFHLTPILLPLGSLWLFRSLLAPFSSNLASFWFPLAPFGFLFPLFRGSLWNCNAFSYHLLRFLLRHVHAHSAVAGPRLAAQKINTHIGYIHSPGHWPLGVSDPISISSLVYTCF